MSALKALFGFVVMMTCGLPVLAGDASPAPAGAPAEPAKAHAAVAASIPMPVVQPKFEEYVSTMLIVGKWGEKPGEYQYTIGEGSYSWPRQFVVTDEEHIYILDQINNRVQHYNAEGKLLEMIPIESYKLASEKEIKANHDLEYSVVSVDEFKYINGTIFAIGEKRQGNVRTAYTTKLQGNRFKKVILAKDLKRIEKELADARLNAQSKHLFGGDSKFQFIAGKANSGIPGQYVYDGIVVYSGMKDKYGNKWLIGSNTIRKYSSDGRLLFTTPCNDESVIISESGSLYVLDLYPPKKEGAPNLAFEDAYEGIGVRKYYLKQPVKK